MTDTQLNTPLTAEEKTERTRQRYLTLIEQCNNHEYLTREERSAAGLPPEVKKAATAARIKLCSQS
jgi:hypothetical protein